MQERVFDEEENIGTLYFDMDMQQKNIFTPNTVTIHQPSHHSFHTPLSKEASIGFHTPISSNKKAPKKRKTKKAPAKPKAKPKSPKPQIAPHSKTVKRCPNGYRKNKKTRVCEKYPPV